MTALHLKASFGVTDPKQMTAYATVIRILQEEGVRVEQALDDGVAGERETPAPADGLLVLHEEIKRLLKEQTDVLLEVCSRFEAEAKADEPEDDIVETHSPGATRYLRVQLPKLAGVATPLARKADGTPLLAEINGQQLLSHEAVSLLMCTHEGAGIEWARLYWCAKQGGLVQARVASEMMRVRNRVMFTNPTSFFAWLAKSKVPGVVKERAVCFSREPALQEKLEALKRSHPAPALAGTPPATPPATAAVS